MEKPLEILVHLDWRHVTARDICAGVLRYAVSKPGWNVTIGGNLPPGNGTVFRRGPKFDGIVSGYGSFRALRGVRTESTRAIVFLCGNEREPRLSGMADIRSDDAAVGRMAAEFFLKRGFSSFGFVETPAEGDWSTERRAAFCERLARDGAVVRVFGSLVPSGGKPDVGILRKRLSAWVKALPKPAAVLAANDLMARSVLDICVRCGVSVPDQVSLLGVDDDFCICEGSRPALSSIALDFSDGGFKAAEMLDAMMRGGERPAETVRYGVREIVERESTDDSHGFRRTARLALDYMRNNYGWRELRIGDVAAALHCSRSHLEKSFRAANGTSPADALREIRLAHVCDLLRSTGKPIDRIAALCGFAPLHLMTAFRRRYGVTMGAFRRNRILPPSSSSFGRSP